MAIRAIPIQAIDRCIPTWCLLLHLRRVRRAILRRFGAEGNGSGGADGDAVGGAAEEGFAKEEPVERRPGKSMVLLEEEVLAKRPPGKSMDVDSFGDGMVAKEFDTGSSDSMALESTKDKGPDVAGSGKSMAADAFGDKLFDAGSDGMELDSLKDEYPVHQSEGSEVASDSLEIVDVLEDEIP